VTYKSTRLADLCEFQGGSQPPKSKFIYEPSDGYIRFLQIRDFGSDKNLTYIPIDKKNRICSSDDIMIGRYGASVGKILRGRSGAYNVALMKVTPDTNIINKEYLWYYLNSPNFQSNLLAVASRSAQDGFSKDDIANFQVLTPPLPTQQKIVNKLDAIFSELEKAFVGAQSNIKNAEALFQSYLTQVFESGGEGWKNLSIEEITIKTKNISPEKEPHQEFIYVDVSSVSNEHFRITNTQKLFGKDAPSRAKKHIIENDILFATVRPTLKRVAIVPKELDNQVASTGYVILRASKKNHNKFIYFFLLSNSFMDAMKKLQKGASYPAVSDNDVKQQKLKVPELLEQIAISNKLERLMEAISSISKLNKSKISELSLLKSLILKQAFESAFIKE
jgi:type I restriction enzyme S subunit